MMVVTALVACEVEVPVGEACLLVTEVAAQETNLLWRTADCTFEQVPLDPAVPDPPETRPDWIEICNPSQFRIDAGKYLLSLHPDDNPYAPDPLPLPPIDLDPGDCLVMIGLPNHEADCGEIANFTFDRQLGPIVRLEVGQAGSEECLDGPFNFPELAPGSTWSRERSGAGWRWVQEPTPTPMSAVLR